MPTSFFDRSSLPLRERLHAWWIGVDPEALHAARLRAQGRSVREDDQPRRQAATPRSTPAAQTAAATPAEPGPYWSQQRIGVAQSLWGDGFTGPPTVTAWSELVKPLGIDATMTVAEIGSGLGGVSRLLHERSGAYVRGFEPSKPLCAAAARAALGAGLGKRTQFVPMKDNAPEVRSESLDRVLVRETLHRVRDRGAFLEAVIDGLKPGAQLFMTEYLMPRKGPWGAAAVEWGEAQEVVHDVWTAAELEAALTRAGLTIHILKDEAPMLSAEIVAGWARLRDRITGEGGIEPELVEALLEEGEKWRRTNEAIKAGELMFCRLHATMPA